MSSRWAARTRTPPSVPSSIPRIPIACRAARAAARRRRFARGFATRPRHGHGRLDPLAGKLLRRGRIQADLRHDLTLRPGGVRVFARSDRAARALGGRRGALDRGDVGVTIRWIPPRPGGRLALAPALAQTRASFAIGIPKEFFVGGLQPDVERAIQDSLRRFEKQGAELVPVSLPHTQLCRRGLLSRGRERGLEQPRALRRRALRRAAAGRGVRAEPGRVLREGARRLRTRGQAPDHPGHLRALERLRRSVLPARLPGAEAHSTGFRSTRSSRSISSRVRSRRRPRSGSARRRATPSDVPERHLHDPRQPRRASGAEPALRAGRAGLADRPASHGAGPSKTRGSSRPRAAFEEARTMRRFRSRHRTRGSLPALDGVQDLLRLPVEAPGGDVRRAMFRPTRRPARSARASPGCLPVLIGARSSTRSKRGWPRVARSATATSSRARITSIPISRKATRSASTSGRSASTGRLRSTSKAEAQTRFHPAHSYGGGRRQERPPGRAIRS